MGKSKELSTDLRMKIVEKHVEGDGYKKISRALDMPISTVRTVIAKWKSTGSVDTLPRPGRPSKVPATTARKIVRDAKINPQATSTEIQASLKSAGVEVGKTTVRRILNKYGLFGRVARKKPLLRPFHKKARLVYAKQHLNQSTEYWKKIIWSDETKIELFGHNQNRYVWRQVNQAHKEKYTKPTVKHGGGSLMFWGCVSFHGTGNLVKVEGRMDSVYYQQILNENLHASARKLKMGRNFQFQHDNDPKHRSKSTIQWLRNKKVKVLEWPSQSPDLNIIEGVWGELKKAVYKRHPKNLKELEEICHDEWTKLPAEVIQKLLTTYNNRLLAVIAAKGGNTKY
jgi:transposase